MTLRDLPLPAARVDGALAVLDASRAAWRLFGLGEGPAVRLAAAIGSAAGLGDELALATARLTRPGEEAAFEWRRADRVYEVHVGAGDDGASFLALFHDVTEARGLEEIQLEARHYLEQVMADIPLGVAVLDARLRVTFANRGALGLLARIGAVGGLVDAIGADLAALVGEAGERWRDLCARARDGGERADGPRETFGGRPPLVLAVAAHPLHDRRGDRSGALLVLEDVTERARLEGEVIRMERLATVGQMVITVNHEINNPLTIISANAQSARLLNRDLDERTKAKLVAIEEQVKRISAVTERLRTMDEVAESEYIADGPKMIDPWRGGAPR